MDETKPLSPALERKQAIKNEIINVLTVIAATLIYSVSTYVFVIGNDFAPSGLSGVLSMIEYKFNLNAGTFVLLLLNLPLLIWSMFSLSKRFAINTTISVFILCGSLFLLEYIDKDNKFHFSCYTNVNGVEILDFGKRFFASIVSGFFAGVAIAMSFRANSSLGGVDIIVMIIQKKHPRANVSALLFGVNIIIIVASWLVFENIESVYFAIIYIIIFSKVCEYILNGVKRAIKFEVVTSQPDELARDLIDNLGHGVTVTNARGMYQNTDRYLLICVIRDRQIGDFENILKKYPDSFAFSSSVSEVFGRFLRK